MNHFISFLIGWITGLMGAFLWKVTETLKERNKMSETKAKTAVMEEKEPSISERFTNMVIFEFSSISGDELKLSALQKKLAKHLFISVDQVLAKNEIAWNAINLKKLAVDAVHRINLGLDALIPNHISPIPYHNKKEGKYDIDLRIGYAGKDYYKRKMALIEPLDIIYELVYSKDKFIPKKKSLTKEIEGFEFEISSPFDRGEIVGGFGYIIYEDPKRNKLVIVTETDFKKAEGIAKTGTFWKDFPVEMRYKTLVHRVTEKLIMDPEKVNESYAIVEAQDSEGSILQQIEDKANKEVIDIEEGPQEILKETSLEPEKDSKKTEPINPRKLQNGGPDF